VASPIKSAKTAAIVVCLKMILTYFFSAASLGPSGSLPGRPYFRPLSVEHDGVQDAVSVLISPNTLDDIMIKIITTLWFIWRARNELRFRQNKWSVMQVHYAVQVHIQANVQPLMKNAGSTSGNGRKINASLEAPKGQASQSLEES